MAEVVEQNMQTMLKEMDFIKKKKLMAEAELKKLIQVRREFEYKFVKAKKEKRDFVAHVNYESKVLELLHIRRKTLNVDGDTQNIEGPIARRVLRKLRFMTRAWPQHLDLWELRRNFCKYRKYNEEVTSAFLEQIAFHGNDEQLWVSWAQWEMEHLRNFDSARDILLSKAPSYHPNSLFIAKECFRLELLFIEYAKQEKMLSQLDSLEEVPLANREKVLNFAIPEAIYEDAKERFESAEMHAEFYSVTCHWDSTKDLGERIFSDMLDLYPNDKTTWLVKLRKEFSKYDPAEHSENLDSYIEELNAALENVGDSYLPFFIKEMLHNLYKFWTDSNSAKKLQTSLIVALENHKDSLTSSQWLILCELTLTFVGAEKNADLLNEAALKYPENQRIMFELFKLEIQTENSDADRLKVFRRRTRTLEGETARDSWAYMLSTLEDEENIEQMLQKGVCNSQREVSFMIRMDLLKNNDMNQVRESYKKHCWTTPFFAEFHIEMIRKELTTEDMSLVNARLAFDTAVRQFGKDQLGLWLSYSEFERKYENALKANKLIKKAEQQLDSAKVNQFMCLRSLITMKHEDVTETYSTAEKSKEELQGWETSAIVESNSIQIVSENEERNVFFKTLKTIQSWGEKKKTTADCNDKEWEHILKLLGTKIFINRNNYTVEGDNIELQAHRFLLEKASFMDKNKLTLSSTLDAPEPVVCASGTSDIVQKALAESDILQPGFDTQTKIEPYWQSRRSVTKTRKAEADKTAGKGWFNMKAPEMTKDIETGLNLLKNRAILDPKRHYKRSDMKTMPKYFQLGKVEDSAYDFYSDRVYKKDRKKTFAEEIVTNEQILKHQKRKYTEVVTQTRRKRHSKKKKV